MTATPAQLADLRAAAVDDDDVVQVILCDIAIGDRPDAAALQRLDPESAAHYEDMLPAEALELCEEALAINASHAEVL